MINEPLNTEQLERDIKDAVATESDVKEKVRHMTIKALTEGHLDMQSVRQVADAVIKGASLGASASDSILKKSLEQAASGLDEALSTAAEASKLALKEAASRGEEFSSHDLKRTLNDLKGLEELFVDTLQDAASSSKGQLSIILNELAEHAQRSGTAVGKQIERIVTDLVKQLGDISKDQLETGVETIKTTGSLLARMAAGMLEGIADSLHTSESNNSSQDKNR
ncbi:MAG: hypothetical protein DRQ40_07600 [Gammaproteobacteria bacterium]|nr:MAG: hypothetical protein DRQ40_07600 [Gammaproteobacteria bacterium]HHA19279.1 hypothetical protein [Methylophaga sp.]